MELNLCQNSVVIEYFGCQHSAFDVVLSFVVSIQFGPCSKRSPEYASNPGSFADDRIYFIWSSAFHFHFGSYRKIPAVTK